MLKKLLITLLLTTVVFATVTSTEVKRQYFVCNGSTTTYTFTMECNSSDDIRVEKRIISTGVPTSLVEDTDYTIANTGDSYLEGGVVTIDPALASTYSVVIIREIVQTQETIEGAMNAAAAELALDKVTRLAQDARNDIDQRVLRIPDSDPSTAYLELVNSVERAGYWLGFDSTTGAPYVGTPAATGISVSAFMATLNDDATAALARDTLLLTDGTADLDVNDLDVNDIITKGPWVDVRVYDAVADSGTTDNATAIAATIAAASAGDTIFFPSSTGYYSISSAITVDKALVFEGAGEASEIRQATSDTDVFIVTVSNVEFRNLHIRGPQYANSKTGEIGINAYGADKDNYIEGLKIKDCKIQSFGHIAISLSFVEDFELLENDIENIHWGGVIARSVRRGFVSGNNINNISGDYSNTAYGIGISREGQDSITDYPRSSDVEVSNNIVRSVPNWEGYDTHAGERISFINNKAYNCFVGINIGAGGDGSSLEQWAPLDCLVIGNEIDSGLTDGTARFGITFTGAYSSGATVELATGVIQGNIVRGHGDEDSDPRPAVYVRDTTGLVISGNVIIEASPYAIALNGRNYDFSITGNSLIDFWTNTLSESFGVYARLTDNTGYIGGNSFGKEAKSATHVLDRAIFIANDTGNNIQIGPNWSEATYYLVDIGQKSLRGTVNTSTSSSGTGEDTIATTTIPADSIGIGRFLKVRAAGTVTNANGNKTIKFYLGSTSITVQPADNLPTTSPWKLDVLIEYGVAGTQRISWSLISETGSNVNVHQGYTTASEDMTGDVIMKVTGECAHASDVITQTMWVIPERY